METSTHATPLYLNRHSFTDVDPYEVVRVISETTVEIRAMVATLDPNWKPDFVAGGFCGHVTNNRSQKYTYQSDPNAPILRARRTKSRVWSVRGNKQFFESHQPIKFHDYNF